MGTASETTTTPGSTHRDVMVLESHPGAARRAADRLADAGHTVHTCHGADAPSFPCNGLVDGAPCPLDAGVDAALVVRRGVVPRPTPTEDGVTCALRAGIPLVEDGSDLLDPYASFLSARVWSGEDPVEVVERAVHDALVPLEDAVAASLVPFLTAAGRSGDEVSVHAEAEGSTLHLHLEGPALGDELSSRLSVKAADTARALQRRWDSVQVSLAT